MTINRKQLTTILETFDKAGKLKGKIFGSVKLSAENGILTLVAASAGSKHLTVAELPCNGDLAEKLYEVEALLKICKVSKEVEIHIIGSDADGHPCADVVNKLDNMPPLPAMIEQGEIKFSIESADLAAILNTLGPFVSTDETRYFMNGVYLEHDAEAEFIRFVATNGRILGYYDAYNAAYSTLPAFGRIAWLSSFKLPKKSSGKIWLRFTENHIELDLIQRGLLATSYKRYTALIDGQFPNYKRIIPENLTSKFSVSASELVQNLKITGSFADKKNKRLFFRLNNNTLSIIVKPDYESEAIYNVAQSIQYDGEPVEFAMNYAYLANCFIGIEGDATVKFIDNSRVFVVDCENSMRLIMPMNID
jgi:DNA polymerase-3 subunit beta